MPRRILHVGRCVTSSEYRPSRRRTRAPLGLPSDVRSQLVDEEPWHWNLPTLVEQDAAERRRGRARPWVGDSLDGWVARLRDCETRTGAVLDILSDRLCARGVLHRPGLAGAAPRAGDLRLPGRVHGGRRVPVARLPGLADHQPQLLLRHRPEAVAANWSHPGKAVNSGLFAILLLVTGWMWVGLAIALALLSPRAGRWPAWSGSGCRWPWA